MSSSRGDSKHRNNTDTQKIYVAGRERKRKKKMEKREKKKKKEKRKKDKNHRDREVMKYI